MLAYIWHIFCGYIRHICGTIYLAYLLADVGIYPGGDWHPGMSLCEIKANLSKKNDGILNQGESKGNT